MEQLRSVAFFSIRKAKRITGKTALAGLIAVALLSGLSPALAGHWHKQQRQRDFFAYAGSDRPSLHLDPPTSNAGGCFVTLSPMEAAKGIRHFRGNC